jgi:hypothetical protein
MNHGDIASIMKGLAPVVRDYVISVAQPLVERIAELELRLAAAEKSVADVGERPDQMMMLAAVKDEVTQAVAALPKPADGKDADPAIVAKMVADAVAALPPPAAGRDADPADVERAVKAAVAALPPAPAGKDADPAVIEEAVAKAVAALPEPDLAPIIASMKATVDGFQARLGETLRETNRKAIADEIAKMPKPRDGEPGRGVTVEDVAPLIEAAVEKRVAAIPPAKDGEPGKGVTVDDVRPLVRDIVSEAVAALPRGIDGKDADPEIVRKMVEDAVGAIPPARDGVGLAGALIDRAGDLTLTLTDGTLRNLGPVVGKDADISAAVAEIKAAVAAIPIPKDGKDGKDGVGFDDMTVEHDGERLVTLNYIRGDQKKTATIHLPIPIDRGVYKAGTGYERGDTVTWGGSLWIAQEATSDKPETTRAWRLSVKKGRDGKDGLSVKGEKGETGRPGRDLTQLGFDGEKH